VKYTCETCGHTVDSEDMPAGFRWDGSYWIHLECDKRTFPRTGKMIPETIMEGRNEACDDLQEFPR